MVDKAYVPRIRKRYHLVSNKERSNECISSFQNNADFCHNWFGSNVVQNINRIPIIVLETVDPIEVKTNQKRRD